MSNHKLEEDKIKEVYDFISSVNRKAYNDIFLLSSQVLSKNPFTNNFLHRYLDCDKVNPKSLLVVFAKLLKYYLENFKDFAVYIIEFIEYGLCPLPFSFFDARNELILIDTFFVRSKIKDLGNYTDSYFPGLENVLKKYNKRYAYLPVFGGFRKNIKFSDILKVLKKDKVPVLTEYQLLTIRDLIYLLYFILAYPFHVLKFLNTLHDNNYETELLKDELINTLDSENFHSFSRYLQGRRISKLPYDSIKVISWYENQVIDKNLYKGLRTAGGKVKIYGAQLFLYARNHLNVIPDENEAAFGTVPDRIIVNGPFFIPKESKLNYTVGASLRYAKIFNDIRAGEDKTDILALLPYFKKDIENILSILSSLEYLPGRIIIKPHPSVNIKEIRRILPKNVLVVQEDIYKLFETAKIIISNASGTMIEAASMGIPVISIKNKLKSSCNPLPEYGRGIIWEEASGATELLQQINKFEYTLNNNFKEVRNIANKYKEMFFCKPTEENIVRTFDL